MCGLIPFFRFKLNIKQAIEYIALAWDNISADTIKNCWRHTGVLPPVCDDANMMDIAGSEMNQENEIEMLVDSLPDENRTTIYKNSTLLLLLRNLFPLNR